MDVLLALKKAKRRLLYGYPLKVVKASIQEALKALDGIEWAVQVEKEALSVIKSWQYKNLARLYQELEKWIEKVEKLYWVEGPPQRSSGQPLCDTLPIKYSHLEFLAGLKKWKTDPPLVNKLTIFECSEVLLVRPYAPRKMAQLRKDYQAQRIGGEFLLLRKAHVAVAQPGLPISAVQDLLQGTGWIPVGQPNNRSQLVLKQTIPLEFSAFLANFRNAKEV